MNTILYGPPGTGKTFFCFQKAVDICDGKAPAEPMARFEELRQAGRIEFVTFHQSFSYEEFVEGLRPVLDEKVENGARYEIRDGIFKQIARRAAHPFKPRETDFERLWHGLVQDIEDKTLSELAGLSPHTHFRLSVDENHRTIWGENAKTERKNRFFKCSPQTARLIWEKTRDFPVVNSGDVRRIADLQQPAGFVAVVVNQLKLRERAPLAPNGQNAPPFVLIIDEINRGNISKIFGELITLLEPDKRLGAAHSLRVRLPYSQENFGVPSNLFVLATMNTADKSLALLDIALRRRFVFEEVRPDFDLPILAEQLTDEMRAVLKQLNARLMAILDREHRIGHAFFMQVNRDCANFNAVFGRSIVPLLQEFFYSDWQGLREVLGENGKGNIVGKVPEIAGISPRTNFAWWSDLDWPTPDFLAVLARNYGVT